MPNTEDKSGKKAVSQAKERPADLSKHSQQETDVDFGPTMSLKQAQALREGQSIDMEAFKARFEIE